MALWRHSLTPNVFYIGDLKRMSNKQARPIQRDLKQEDLILITGAGGFIGGSLVRYFHDLGYTHLRAVDKKPLSKW